MDNRAARAIALNYILNMSNMSHEYAIMDQFTVETERSWVFFYQHRKWVESGDRYSRIMGNLPVLVDKSSGEVREVPSGGSIGERISLVEKRIEKRKSDDKIGSDSF